MLYFNQKGLLIPEGAIMSTLTELEQEFVIKQQDGKRKELFEGYKQYVANLKKACRLENITQWVNGSYVTQSKNPSDIDIVNFLDFKTVKEYEKELKKFVYPQSIENYGIDAYIVVVYPPEEKFDVFTKSDRAYWLNHFGKTKPTRQRKATPKGFLEIIV